MNQLIKFQEKSIEMLTVNGRPALTAETIGKALGYAEPRDAINTLFNRNRDEFNENEDYLYPQIEGAGQRRETLVFFSSGAILLCMFSKQPLAKEFRKWAKQVLAAELSGAGAQQNIAELERQVAALKYESYFLANRGAKLRKITRAMQLYEMHVLSTKEIARAVPIDLGLLEHLIALRLCSQTNAKQVAIALLRSGQRKIS